MGVKLRGFGAVMAGVRAMAGGRVRMMRRRFDVFIPVMFGGHAVMMRCFFMMVSGGVMMGAGRMPVRHGKISKAGVQAHRSSAKQTCQGLLIFKNQGR